MRPGSGTAGRLHHTWQEHPGDRAGRDRVRDDPRQQCADRSLHQYRRPLHHPEQCKIFSSSLYYRVTIGANTTISGSIIDNDTQIGEGCSIENDTVIGPRVVLQNCVVVHSKTRIWPEVVVGDGTVVKEHLLNDKFDLRYKGS